MTKRSKTEGVNMLKTNQPHDINREEAERELRELLVREDWTAANIRILTSDACTVLRTTARNYVQSLAK